MRTLLPLIALAIACSGKGAEPGPPAEGEVAGVVLELSGTATAQNPGQSKARPLHPGAELVAGDVVATEEGASLRARLYHNRALLVLGGGKMLALRDSPAWKATPAAGSLLEGAVGQDGTGVAGRHAENQGADTSATGRLAPPSTTPEPVGGSPPPDPADVKDGRKGGAPGSGGSQGNSTTTLKEPEEARPPAGGGASDDWGTIGESGSLQRADVQKGMRELAQAFQKCWSQSPPGALEFGYRLRVSVRPDGTVRAVDIDETTGQPPEQVTRCVVAAVKGGTFPRSKRGVTFTYPVSFKPSE